MGNRGYNPTYRGLYLHLWLVAAHLLPTRETSQGKGTDVGQTQPNGTHTHTQVIIIKDVWVRITSSFFRSRRVWRLFLRDPWTEKATNLFNPAFLGVNMTYFFNHFSRYWTWSTIPDQHYWLLIENDLHDKDCGHVDSINNEILRYKAQETTYHQPNRLTPNKKPTTCWGPFPPKHDWRNADSW